MKNHYPKIKVFVTKASKNFRAKIQESIDTPAYEVTVGGKSWREGKGLEYRGEIKRKCKILISVLNSKLKDI
jgi:hypothetical protein